MVPSWMEWEKQNEFQLRNVETTTKKKQNAAFYCEANDPEIGNRRIKTNVGPYFYSCNHTSPNYNRMDNGKGICCLTGCMWML